MGFLGRLLFGLPDDDDEKEEEEIEPLTSHLGFITPTEEKSYSESIRAKLRSMETSAEMKLINKHFKSGGGALRTQAQAIRNALRVIKKEGNDTIQESFEVYCNTFNKLAREAKGIEAFSNLEKENESMKKDFNEAIAKSELSEKKIKNYISKIGAIQYDVDLAEDEGMPILEDDDRNEFTGMTFEAQYRLKMLEMLLHISMAPNDLGGEEMVNPFKDMTPREQDEYAQCFNEDLNELAEEYERLSDSWVDIDTYGENHHFSDMDDVVKSFNVDYSVQSLKDPSLKRLFSEPASSGQLFEFIKKIVFIRYKINEINGEFTKTMDNKREDEARREREAKEAYEREQEELRRREEERRRVEERNDRLMNATDEELQEMLNDIKYKLDFEGNENTVLLECQMEIAKLRGLIPEENPMDSDAFDVRYYTASQIIDFVKIANKNGLRYRVFPNARECAKADFCVIASHIDPRVDSHAPLTSNEYTIPTKTFEFGESVYLNANPALRPYKEIGLMPGYFIAEVQRLYDEADEPLKDRFRELVYVDDFKEIEGKKTFRMGVYEYQGKQHTTDKGEYIDGSEAHIFMSKLVRKAKKNLKKVWKSGTGDKKGMKWSKKEEQFIEGVDKNAEDRNVMCYLSWPVGTNFIPVLRAFQECGIKPFFARAEEGSNNQNNRPTVNIYFKREDLDKFYERAQFLLRDTCALKTLHYGRDYNFLDENSAQLKIIEDAEHQY